MPTAVNGGGDGVIAARRQVSEGFGGKCPPRSGDEGPESSASEISAGVNQRGHVISGDVLANFTPSTDVTH